jgi:hypothetical protein
MAQFKLARQTNTYSHNNVWKLCEKIVIQAPILEQLSDVIGVWDATHHRAAPHRAS